MWFIQSNKTGGRSTDVLLIQQSDRRRKKPPTKKQAAKDWEQFLLMRAAELVPG